MISHSSFHLIEQHNHYSVMTVIGTSGFESSVCNHMMARDYLAVLVTLAVAWPLDALSAFAHVV